MHVDAVWGLIWTALMFCTAFAGVNAALNGSAVKSAESKQETKSFTTTTATKELTEQSMETRHQKGNFSIPIAVGISFGGIILLLSIGLAIYAFRLPKLVLTNPIVIGGPMQRRTGVRRAPYAVRRMPYEGCHGTSQQTPRRGRQILNLGEIRTDDGQSDLGVIYEIGPSGIQMSDYEIAFAENISAEYVAKTDNDVTDDAGTYYSSLQTETEANNVYTQLGGNNISDITPREVNESTGDASSSSGTYYSPPNVKGTQAAKDGNLIYIQPDVKGNNTPAGLTEPDNAETELNRDASADSATYYCSLRVENEVSEDRSADTQRVFNGDNNNDLEGCWPVKAGSGTGETAELFMSPAVTDEIAVAESISAEYVAETDIDVTDDTGTYYSSLQTETEAKDVYSAGKK